MRKSGSVQYFYDRNSRIELILCADSEISYPMHNHVSVITIGMVLCGEVLLTVGGSSFSCKKDCCFSVLPYVPHSIEAENPYSLLTLCIKKNAAGDDGIKEKVRHLLDSACKHDLSEIQMLRLLACLDSLDNLPRPRPFAPSIDSARMQIEGRPEARLCIGEMARALNVSKYHFTRRFKKSVGMTPHQFQIQNRVRKAQRMLASGESMMNAALTAGFCDQSHFIRCFERHLGITPQAYKISCKILERRDFH